MGKSRPQFEGFVKEYDKSDLTDEKIKSLEDKGWVLMGVPKKSSKKETK